MNNYLAMNICEAIMPIKDDSVNVTIEEARDKRSKLAMSFFSRAVVIVDENENEVE